MLESTLVKKRCKYRRNIVDNSFSASLRSSLKRACPFAIVNLRTPDEPRICVARIVPERFQLTAMRAAARRNRAVHEYTFNANNANVGGRLTR